MPIPQPYLHDSIVLVQAPTIVLGRRSGQLGGGADGVYVGDRRILSELEIRLDGVLPEPVRHVIEGARRAEFLAVARTIGDDIADPTVTVERTREVHPDGMTERVAIVSRARDPVRTSLRVGLACDLAEMTEVKHGAAGREIPPVVVDAGIAWQAENGTRVLGRFEPAPRRVEHGTATWEVDLPPHTGVSVTIDVRVVADPLPTVVLPASDGLEWSMSVRSTQRKAEVDALIAHSFAEVNTLTLSDPMEPADRFLAAGAPWYLTLFGRDSLWAARLLLPAGTALAGGTLRTLARRQGSAVNVETAEEPGKILHELRRTITEFGDTHLPPLYYGTVDATALWVSLLHDAWRWGLPAAEVEALLPTAARAMEWITSLALDPAGFVSYVDRSGHGLANQGWKDSDDSVQFADGRLAEAPLALCEVQGYAYEAARQAAELFDAFGRPAPDWRSWADELAARFRASFWLDGGYPAIALDRSGQRVDTLTSNIAHLLGTGLLTPEEQARVVAALGRPEMSDGFGLRTMSSAAAGYNPLSYHGGSVWTHDTAIAVRGLATLGTPEAHEVAVRLIDGLLAAAPAFGHRLPELYGGHRREGPYPPAPYPAACRPQAWAAAGAIALVSAALGIHADVPAARVRLNPMRPSPFGAIEVRGLRVGGEELDLDLAADGTVHVVRAPSGLRIEVA